MKKILIITFIFIMMTALTYAEYPASVVSYWNFSGGAATDAVGSNDGILSGTSSVSGLVGGAIEFTRNSSLTIPHSEDLNMEEGAIEILLKQHNATDIIKIESSRSSTCILLANGRIKCSGYWIGDGTNLYHNTPVYVQGIDNAVDISLGNNYGCALLNDSTIKCWGRNYYGQLGDGSKTDRATPITVSGISNAASIIAGYSHTCSLLTDGSIKCWGENGDSQLGDGSTTDRYSPVSVQGISNAVDVQLSQRHSCALLSTGEIKCWGENSPGSLGDGTGIDSTTPVSVLGINNAIKINLYKGTNAYHSCALLNDNTIKCWGQNNQGQLGDGTQTSKDSPVTVQGINNAIDIKLSYYHTCALLSDGLVKCWGYNAYGNVGSGSSDYEIHSPATVLGVNNAVNLSIGGNYNCALLENGTVKCWGYNQVGQLGDGTIINKNIPVSTLGISTAVDITTTTSHACALLSDGNVECWGYNSNGQLGIGRTLRYLIPVDMEIINDFKEIKFADDHSCAVLNNGSIKCWGKNSYGILGDGTEIERTLPVFALGITNAENVALGYDHSCALLSGGSIKCWGSAGNGRLGDGTTTSSSTPVSVLGITNAARVSLGPINGGHVCALLDNNRIKCWGSNWNGQLGDGTETASSTPVYVQNIYNAIDVKVGTDHSCALLSNSYVKCWGRNSYGQIGSGSSETEIHSPATVTGITNAVNLSVGYWHSCVLLDTGRVKCWGENDWGQLGDGTTTNRNTPVEAQGITNAIKLVMESDYGNFLCALLSDGHVKCWGKNNYGQLGDGSTTNRYSPVTVLGVDNAVDIKMGRYHVCALLNNGTVKCWGQNNYGQLGDGTQVHRNVSVEVYGIDNAVNISRGYHQSCAYLDNGEIKCWGDNQYSRMTQKSTNSIPQKVTNKLFSKQYYGYSIYLSDAGSLKGFINEREVDENINNSWHSIVLNYNKSQIGLYVDGNLTDSKQYSRPINPNPNDLTMSGFEGLIDEIVIYNQSLTPAEISAHHSGFMSGTAFGSGGSSPVTTTFTSSETTNFSDVTLSSITSLTLAIDNKGKIAFPSGHSINSENEDYDTNVKIEDALIYVNSAALDSSFNDSATLTFEGINCNAPYVYYSDTASTRAAILAENTLCPSSICSNIQCSAGILTVNVTHFSGYAVNGTANLTIDADDPKFPGQLVTFTAEYRNATGLITGATCTIILPDGAHAMNPLASDIYNYSTTYATAQIVVYNVTCSATGESTVFANDTAEIQSTEIPEFSTMTLGLGLIAVLGGLFTIRRKK